MDKAEITMIIGQAVLFLLQCLLYFVSRTRFGSMLRDVFAIEPRIETIRTVAESAKAIALSMEVEHYKKLQGMLLDCETRSGQMAAKIASLEESLSVVNAKLASRERMDRKERAQARETTPPEKEAEGEDAELAELVRSGKAFSLGPTAATAAPPGPPRTRPFGSPL